MEYAEKFEEQTAELPEVQPVAINCLHDVDLSLVTQRVWDKSFVVMKGGHPYHVPNNEEFADFYAQLAAYVAEHPGVLVEEHPYEPSPEELAAQTLARAKAERAEAVAALTVEVDGMVFDGDEKAQERMARAVLMAESPEETIEWVLADHSTAEVCAEQLRRACRAAGKAQSALWVLPYKGE
ncbi:MAG: DUF4376 domain-containing protein [Mailhella sp.]|nr:DUF4376 domain-containing protein [Mailhella sp.]